MHERAQAVAGEPPVRPERREAEDVQALGRILYATLVSRWPGGAEYGLPAAPITASGAWQTPAQVRAGVSPALDRIADRILNPEPRSGEPIRTVARIALELSAVLGTADASHDLERRVRYLLANPSARVHGQHDDDPDATAIRAPGTHVEQLASVTSPLLTPVPPPAPAQVAAPARRVPWIAVLVGFVVIGLVGAGIATALNWRTISAATGAGASAARSGTPSAGQTPAGPHSIAGAKDFDPEADKGNGTENTDQLQFAYDGKPDTAWTTMTYLNYPKMGNLKPGVGIILDLGKAVPVSAVQLLLVGNGTSVELRVPAVDAATLTSPPMSTVRDWTVVADATNAGTNVQLTPSAKVTTRYVMVYVTQLPQVAAGRYQAGVAEVSVLP